MRPNGRRSNGSARDNVMLRRPFTEEPMSRLAAWSGRLGWFALAVAALSVVIVRSGVLEIVPALATFAAALVFAALAVLLALAAFVSIWRQGYAGLGRAVLGLVSRPRPARLSGLSRHPRPQTADDLRRDHRCRPIRRASTRSRARGRAISSPILPRFAPLQRAAYPNIGPLQYDAPPKLVYDIALALVTKRKWRVADARRAGAGAPRRRDRGGGALADHGISRRRRHPHRAGRRRHARRYSLGLAPSLARPRRQRRARAGACSTISTTR